MCQIIHKVRNYSLPFNLVSSTCVTNPDGFGVMMFDGKGLITDRVYTGKDNDPEKIAKFLETIHDEEAFIHFRFKTRGLVGTDSCHPFKIYDDNDREVYLMHNGTFTDYGSTSKVDSEEFGEKVVAPLYDTFLKSGKRKPLNDKFFHDIMNKFVGAGSKVVLMDNTGDHAIINEKAGELFEDKEQSQKFWVSNLYSFNRYHRSSTHTTYSYGRGGSQTSNSPFHARTGNAASDARVGPTSAIGTASGQNTNREVGSVPKRTPKMSYWKDILELDSIDDILDMTNEDIGELVDLEPENAKLLIKDLIYELYASLYTSPVEVEEEIEDVVEIN